MGDWNTSGGDGWGSGGATTSFNTNDEWNSGSAGADGWKDGGATDNFNDGGAAPGGGFGGSGDSADASGPTSGGGCFNCGQDGHMKSECPNPRVERPFQGTCRTCDQEGHMSKDCPNKPKYCKQCFMENDHDTMDCKNPKKIDNSGVPDMSEQDAWSLIKEASDDADVGDFREAVKILSKAVPEMTYPQLEKELRKRQLNIFLVGLKKEVAQAYTNTDLQGAVGRPYQLGIFTKSSKCPRPMLMEMWPKDDAENLERLRETGVPLDRGIMICSNCGELGHTRKGCKQDSTAPEPMKIMCVLCDEAGHRARDCTQERPQPRAARTCKVCDSPDHMARDCLERECRNCRQKGHDKDDCTNERVMVCRNCDGIGHVARECKEAKDWSKHKCRHCGEFGHGSENRCDPEKKAAHAAAQAAAEGDAGGDTNDFDNGAAPSGDDGWNQSGNSAGGSGQADWENDIPSAAPAITVGGGGSW